MADLGPGTMPRGKYPESPAPAGSHALISRTPTPGGMLHANLGLPRPPPRNFQPPLPQQPPKQTQQRRHNVPPVQSLRDSAAATTVGCAAWRRRFRIFSFRYREMMSGMTMIFLTVMFFPPGILSQALPWSPRAADYPPLPSHRSSRGIFSHPPELGNDTGLMGALLPFVLRVVAGACVGRGSGQPRMPPQERLHEGLGGWGIVSHVQERTARGG